MDWSPDVAARRPQTAGNFGVREVRYDRKHSSRLADVFQGGTAPKKVNLDIGRVGRRGIFDGSNPAAAPVAERRFPSKQDIGGPSGISNLGNTCFMGCTLQCLISNTDFHPGAVPPLSKFFLDKDFFFKLDRKSKMRGTMALSFGELLFKMRDSSRSTHGAAVSPAALKERVSKFAPQFTGSKQHDCQEFLRFLIDGLCEDLNSDPDLSFLMIDSIQDERERVRLSREAWFGHIQRGYSSVLELFCGQFESRITCMECSNDSFTYDPFMDLSLPMPQDSRHACTVMDCLTSFTAREVLDEADAYWCGHCKAFRKASKELRIRRSPPVLVMHMKRFSYTETSRQKLETPLHMAGKGLDMSSFMCQIDGETLEDGCLYDLQAVCLHTGGLAGGHYTAAVKEGENWYICNDSIVRPAPSGMDDLHGAAPYVLFYVKRD